jgi:hypothetical protein
MMQWPQRDSAGMDCLAQAKAIRVGRGPEREGHCTMALAVVIKLGSVCGVSWVSG